ncbi:hypothetical protein PanWU01x14_156900 [Parasponia andersonii]|uniref:Uncharacterized protein n=1 Tax=Parasponia andersonii TaxID=3476 RepID=A0A2P5CFM7_PARAD|nr:hypothetical protein PanWU01x14_156900 [Parasponia andersonii]
MATTESDENDNHHHHHHQAGCCKIWFEKMVSFCSTNSGSSDAENDDGHVTTDQTEDAVRRPLIRNDRVHTTPFDQTETKETEPEPLDDDHHIEYFHHDQDQDRAVRLVARISRLMVDLVFLISDERGVIEGEEELRKRRSTSTSNPRRRSVNCYWNQRFVDRLVGRFCEQILKLEGFFESRLFVTSELLTFDQNMIGIILHQCAAELDSIEREMACEMIRSTDDDRDQILKKELLVLKVEELWSGVELSRVE